MERINTFQYDRNGSFIIDLNFLCGHSTLMVRRFDGRFLFFITFIYELKSLHPIPFLYSVYNEKGEEAGRL